MRVLILANNDAGLYKFRKELISELVKPGSFLKDRKGEICEVFIALPDGEYIEYLEKIGCVFIKTDVDRRGINPIKDIKLFVKYFKIIKSIKPDVVLTYTIKPNIYGGLACRLFGIRYITNITGLGSALQNNGILTNVLKKMYCLGVRSAQTIFFQNEDNKKWFENNITRSIKSICIPGSGVNLLENCYEPYPLDETIKVLFVGRIMKEKGISEFLDCAESFKRRGYDVLFSLVGPYDDESFKPRVELLHKESIIEYLGKRNDVHEIMKANHVLVLPSYHEGLSNVLLEAAATGRPVIASKIPGCQETFENGISGLAIQPKNSRSLIETLESFLELSWSEKASMGIYGRKKVEREFSRELVIKQYVKEIFR